MMGHTHSTHSRPHRSTTSIKENGNKLNCCWMLSWVSNLCALLCLRSSFIIFIHSGSVGGDERARDSTRFAISHYNIFCEFSFYFCAFALLYPYRSASCAAMLRAYDRCNYTDSRPAEISLFTLKSSSNQRRQRVNRWTQFAPTKPMGELVARDKC